MGVQKPVKLGKQTKHTWTEQEKSTNQETRYPKNLKPEKKVLLQAGYRFHFFFIF